MGLDELTALRAQVEALQLKVNQMLSRYKVGDSVVLRGHICEVLPNDNYRVQMRANGSQIITTHAQGIRPTWNH